MARVLVGIIGCLMLGGCALPVPLQIASWALDGISMLATKKSVSDHAISIVANQDCALWRGVVEGNVCRENDPVAIIVAEGDVTNVNNETELVHGFAARHLGTGYNNPNLDSVALASWVPEAELHVDEFLDGETSSEAFRPVKDTSTFMKDRGAENSQEIMEWQKSSDNLIKVTPEFDGVASYHAFPGDYFVIGSFGVWDNAKNFALKYIDLDARIIAADIADYRLFRIVVGPYTLETQGAVKESIRRSDIQDIWAVRVPSDEITLAWRASKTSIELASVSPSH